MDYLAEEFKKENGIDLRKDPQALQRLQRGGREGQDRAVDERPPTEINLPFITADAEGPKHLEMTLTRAKFEELIDDLMEKTVGPTKQAHVRRRHRPATSWTR